MHHSGVKKVQRCLFEGSAPVTSCCSSIKVQCLLYFLAGSTSSAGSALTVERGAEAAHALGPDGLCVCAGGPDSGVVVLLQVKGLLRHVTLALCDGGAVLHTPPPHPLRAALLLITVTAAQHNTSR